MPEFEANDEMRLPGLRPESSEEPAEGRPAPGARGPGRSFGGRSAARARGRVRLASTLASRRRGRRLSCVAARLAGASRTRRARCQTVRTPPPGQRG